MNNGRLLWIFNVVLIFSMLCGCNISDSARYDSIISIASYTKEQYENGKITDNDTISKYRFYDFQDDKEIAELFADNENFYKSAMCDDDTVIVQENVIFQSVVGFVATKKELMNTNENIRGTEVDVPSALGYDGNCVSIERYVGKFDDWYLYKYHGGL